MVGVNAGSLTASMPAGAKVRTTLLVGTATPVQYLASDGFVGGVTNLDGLVAAYPVPATPTALNTASMFNLHGYAGCGQTMWSGTAPLSSMSSPVPSRNQPRVGRRRIPTSRMDVAPVLMERTSLLHA